MTHRKYKVLSVEQKVSKSIYNTMLNDGLIEGLTSYQYEVELLRPLRIENRERMQLLKNWSQSKQAVREGRNQTPDWKSSTPRILSSIYLTGRLRIFRIYIYSVSHTHDDRTDCVPGLNVVARPQNQSVVWPTLCLSSKLPRSSQDIDEPIPTCTEREREGGGGLNQGE